MPTFVQFTPQMKLRKCFLYTSSIELFVIFSNVLMYFLSLQNTTENIHINIIPQIVGRLIL